MPTGVRCLLARNRMQAAIRVHFADEGFVEVDPAGLQTQSGQRGAPACLRHRGHRQRTRRGERCYLHTSPEFAMKKLLAAGETRIFCLRPCLAQPRARAAARPRIHHARMVPRRRRLLGADERLRSSSSASPPRRPERPAALSRARRATRSPRRSGLASADAFGRFAGIDLTGDAWRRRHHRCGGAAAADAAAGPARRRRTTLGRTWCRACWSSRSSQISALAGRRFSTATPPAEAALARRAADDAAPCRAVRTLCLRRRTRQRLRRTDRRGRTAAALHRRNGRKEPGLWRALSARRGFPCRAGLDAAGKRHRARLRPAGACWRPARRGSTR